MSDKRIDTVNRLAPLLIGFFTLVASVCLPNGFSGWDDLHYLEAAQRWLHEGINLPANHWATRLPYVLAIAANIKMFGVSDLALMVPNSILFVLTMFLLWRIAGQTFGRHAALGSMLIIAATPIFFRMPTTYYPEGMEVVSAAGATLLTLIAINKSFSRSNFILFVAGISGGVGILVRQTAVAVPLALSVLILLSISAAPDRRSRVWWRVRKGAQPIAILACGYAIPLVLEILFYLAMTGNPVERFVIDSRHVLIPSSHLDGGTFKGGSPLFNWTLAARWDVPSLIQLHWTINPVLRVFTSPGLLLTPWLCLAGGVIAFRTGGVARLYAIFAAAGFLTQYVTNTFILVIAPDTRYFSVSVALAMPLAGFLLSRLWRFRHSMAASCCLVTPCLLIIAVEPAPAHLMPALERYLRVDQPLYISRDVNAAATIVFASHPELAGHARVFARMEAIPVGDLATADFYGWSDASLRSRCADGRLEWRPEGSIASPSVPWRVLNEARLTPLVPRILEAHLERDRDRLVLVRRICSDQASGTVSRQAP